MSLQVLGIDHIYIAVADLPRSIAFYDAVMRLLGFRKGTTPVGRLPHVHYYNRAVQYTLRPARTGAAAHDPEIPGLHHVCFQVADRDAVDEAALGLAALGIEVKTPQLYPELWG